jgi:NSS family neurotransmitter:Na+ symporter
MESAPTKEAAPGGPAQNPAPSQPRDRFRTGVGALVVTLGSALGLGNIWKFPSLTGKFGGAGFVTLYLICVALVGLPVLIAELSLGRKARANTITAFHKLSPGKPWYLIGVSGILASFLIMSYYTAVAGWVYAYAAKAATGSLAVASGALKSQFVNLITNPTQALAWQWVAIAVVSTVVAAGVSTGIERVIKKLMPALLVLLVICDVRALTLPGAFAGVTYLLKPDFSAISKAAVLAALGLAFFKLSIGMGAMATYGSYMSDTENIPKTAARVALADTAVSLLAGLAIFPAVFAFGFEPTSGSSLLFMTIPAVFAEMPLGRLFTFLFFVLAAIAATGAMISLTEAVVAWLSERFHLARTKATIVVAAAMAIVGLPVNLSNGVLSGVKVFGLNLFDAADYLTSNIMLPIGGLALAVYAGWVWSKSDFRSAVHRSETQANFRLVDGLRGLVKFVSPVAIAVILMSSIGLIKV